MVTHTRTHAGHAMAVHAPAGEGEFDRTSQQITQALGLSGASPRFAHWLDGQVTGTSPPRTDKGQRQVTANSLNTAPPTWPPAPPPSPIRVPITGHWHGEDPFLDLADCLS
jgi:hypothetical protein